MITAAVLCTLGCTLGCTPDQTPVVALVTLPEGGLGGAPASGQKAGAAATTARDEAPAAKGAAGWASQDVVDGFIEACRGEAEGAEPGEGRAPAPEAAAADRLSGYGKLYQGAQPAPELGPPPADDDFVWVEGNAEYLDPNLISESSGTALAMNFFEGLYAEAPGNTPPVPGQAERHEVSPDGKTYTFFLRDGLRWSDGTPLTAKDFEYAWRRGLDPATGSKNAQLMWFVEGAKAFNTGQTDDPSTVKVAALDDTRFQVTLVAPTPFFVDLVTYVAFYPVPKHAIEAHGKQWVRPEHIVVNGAFKPTSWLPRDKMTMVKNPTYWDADAVQLPSSTVFFSDDEARNQRLYDTGTAHYVKPISEENVKAFLTDGRSDLHIDQQMCTYYYVLKMDRPPFDDPRVRQAFNLALDKERLTRHVLQSRQVPATGLVPDMFRGTLGYEPFEGPGFDPVRAKQLLAEAGFPNGEGFPAVEITYNSFEVHRRIAEFVQENLRKELGVEVTLANMEWKSLLKKVHAGDFQVARTSWCADYPDPLTFLAVFDSKGENNYPGYQNPAYDALLERIRREQDVAERGALMCAAERVLARDVPVVPFYFYTRSYLLRPFVKGLEPQYKDHHLLKYVRIDPS